MQLRRLTAIRYLSVLVEGRTKPVLVSTRQDATRATESTVVKAVGCPEITGYRPLVCEVVGNAIARRMGVLTPEPTVVEISLEVAAAINESLKFAGHGFTVSAGPAAGCTLLHPSPIPLSTGQTLTPGQLEQAGRLYVFDLMSQNADRRALKHNCGLVQRNLVAYDFEMCFAHLWIPVVGQRDIPHHKPSQSGVGKGHLFFGEVRQNPPSKELITAMLSALDDEWLGVLVGSLPVEWQAEGRKLANVITSIRQNADKMSKDVLRSLL